MIEYILIGMLVLAALVGGGWYAYRTYRLVADTPPADTDEVEPAVLERLRANIAKAEENNPVLKQFQMTVHIDTSGFTAALQKAAAAMGELARIIGAEFDVVLTSKKWQAYKPYFDWHDLWVGCYWKLENISDLDDVLTIYIIILPTLVFKFTRTRIYEVVPKVDKRIDPVCIACGMPHSAHSMLNMNNLASGLDRCDGKFII